MAWSPTSDEQRQNCEAGPELAAVWWTQEARKTKKKLKSNSERRFANYGNGLGNVEKVAGDRPMWRSCVAR